jgi:hypothetical protein
MVGKRVQLDDETWEAIEAVMRGPRRLVLNQDVLA